MSNALGCLLKLAGQVVPEVDFEYRVLVGHTTNEIGNQVATYGAWKKARGNVQPGLVHSFNARGVSDTGAIMKVLGFDQSKRVVSVFAYGLELRNIHDQDMPDQIRYHGLIYNIWSISDWFDYDGWKSIVCIEDTREREPVNYRTVVPASTSMFVTNPTMRTFVLDVGNNNDTCIKTVDGVQIAYTYNSCWGYYERVQDPVVGYVLKFIAKDVVIDPNETILVSTKSGKDMEIEWGTDE